MLEVIKLDQLHRRSCLRQYYLRRKACPWKSHLRSKACPPWGKLIQANVPNCRLYKWPVTLVFISDLRLICFYFLIYIEFWTRWRDPAAYLLAKKHGLTARTHWCGYVWSIRWEAFFSVIMSPFRFYAEIYLTFGLSRLVSILDVFDLIK